jgi:hypothetical protein
MRRLMMHHRSNGTIEEPTLLYHHRRTKFRGNMEGENILGIERERTALQLIKEILRAEQDPELKRLIARAGVLLNEVLLK